MAPTCVFIPLRYMKSGSEVGIADIPSGPLSTVAALGLPVPLTLVASLLGPLLHSLRSLALHRPVGGVAGCLPVLSFLRFAPPGHRRLFTALRVVNQEAAAAAFLCR